MENFSLDQLISDPAELALVRQRIAHATQALDSGVVGYKFLWQMMGDSNPEPSKEALIILMASVWEKKVAQNAESVGLILAILLAEKVTERISSD